MRLAQALDSPGDAKAVADAQAKDRDAERARIRAKLSDSDRQFLDEARALFPGLRMVGIRFADGETVGRVE